MSKNESEWKGNSRWSLSSFRFTKEGIQKSGEQFKVLLAISIKAFIFLFFLFVSVFVEINTCVSDVFRRFNWVRCPQQCTGVS